MENKITQIYKIVSPNSEKENLDEMVTSILKILQEEKLTVTYGSRASNYPINSRLSNGYGQPFQNQVLRDFPR